MAGVEMPSPSLVAHLGPCLSDEKTMTAFRYIYENRNDRPPRHISYVRGVTYLPYDDTSFDSDNSDDEAADSSSQSETESFEYSKLAVDLNNIEVDRTPLGLSIGRGSSKKKDEGRAIGLYIGTDGKNTYLVSPMHGIVYFHDMTGVLMVKGASLTNPVVYYADNKPVLLYTGDSRVILSPISRLDFGKLRLNLEIPDRNAEAYRDFILHRDEIFKLAGKTPPDPRYTCLPGKQPFHRIGPAIIHSAYGSSGDGMTAVHFVTGDPLRIDILEDVGGVYFWPKVYNILAASFAFPDQEGLLCAFEACCQHGCSVTAEQYRENGRSSLYSFCKHRNVTVYIFYPATKEKFSAHDWSVESMSFKLQMIRCFLEGLEAMHSTEWMNRSISMDSIHIMSEDPPHAVCSDFKEVFHSLTSWEAFSDPLNLHPPELNGGSHSYKVDCWNAGLVMCEMLLKDDFDKLVDAEAHQGGAWNAHMVRCLTELGRQGSMEDSITRVAIRLISRNPKRRPEISTALENLPTWDYAGSCQANIPSKRLKVSKSSNTNTHRGPTDSRVPEQNNETQSRSTLSSTQSPDVGSVADMVDETTLVGLERMLENGTAVIEVVMSSDNSLAARIQRPPTASQDPYVRLTIPMTDLIVDRLGRFFPKEEGETDTTTDLIQTGPMEKNHEQQEDGETLDQGILEFPDTIHDCQTNEGIETIDIEVSASISQTPTNSMSISRMDQNFDSDGEEISEEE